ncbi:MAG: nucleoside-triphosphatase [Thermoanaerobaculaceae bacterium]|nr:nucleoside-triphosphatase [Thermoanaerobaculaceae bacterium]
MDVTAAAGQWRSNPKWLRAAALGSLWATSEIVLGSFLHNLKVPFRGHALTAIAVLLLAGAQRRWGGRGVVWRAGLVAAVMKSASPSAVLLGPMLAISMEGFAFEAGLAIGRGGLLGCLIGGVLAMSWTFAHLLLSLLLSYGTNLVEVYRQLVGSAAQQLGPLPFGAVGPIAALALVNMAVGVAAALTGWRAGGHRAAAARPVTRGDSSLPVRPARPPSAVTPSLPVLVFLLAALPLGLVALSRVPLPAAVAGMAAFIAAAALRYRAALRRLLRPGFWIGVLTITLTATLVMRFGSGAALPAALAVGMEMTLRAMFVAACFAAIDVELAHRGLRAWLGRHGAGALLGATEAAFATLPEVIASVPSARALIRNPGAAAAAMLPRLDALVDRLEQPPRRGTVVIVTGARGSGKTTLAAAAVESLRTADRRVGGILAPGSWRDGARYSFDVVDLATGSRQPLACREPRDGWREEGSFWIDPAGMAVGRGALSADRADVVVVDEVGPWELRGAGWSSELETLLAAATPLLLVVRRECLDAVVARWSLAAAVFDAADASPAQVAAALQTAAP